MTDDIEIIVEKDGKQQDFLIFKAVKGKYYFSKEVGAYGSRICIYAIGNEGLDALCKKYDNPRFAKPFFDKFRESILDHLGFQSKDWATAKWDSTECTSVDIESFLHISSEWKEIDDKWIIRWEHPKMTDEEWKEWKNVAVTLNQVKQGIKDAEEGKVTKKDFSEYLMTHEDIKAKDEGIEVKRIIGIKIPKKDL